MNTSDSISFFPFYNQFRMLLCQHDKLNWTVLANENCFAQWKPHLAAFIIFLSNLDYDNIECRINLRQLSRINLAAVLLSHPQTMKKLTLSLLRAAKKQFSLDHISAEWTAIVANYKNCGFLKYHVLVEVYSSRCTKLSVTFEDSHHL